MATEKNHATSLQQVSPKDNNPAHFSQTGLSIITFNHIKSVWKTYLETGKVPKPNDEEITHNLE